MVATAFPAAAADVRPSPPKQKASATMARPPKPSRSDVPPPRDRHAKAGPVRGIPASQEYDRGPAPPEETNHDHPGAVGERLPVPGAGIVGSGADAPGATRPQQVKDPRITAPGARRPGTTDTGPEGAHGGAGVGAPAGALDNEVPSDGGTAPLSVPGRNMGPPPGAASGETNALDATSTPPSRRKS
jgi:hypothetical protein